MSDETYNGENWEEFPYQPYVPPPEADEGERLARIRHYWSKIRQALKNGNVVGAAEYYESATHSEGIETGKALRNLIGKLSRGEIER